METQETETTITDASVKAKRCSSADCYNTAKLGEKWCSSICYLRAQKRQRVDHRLGKDRFGRAEAINVGTAGDPVRAGTMAELVAAIDLMRRGFDVYRAMSSASSCDLIAVKKSDVLRVEVRCGYYTKTQGVRCNRKRSDQGRSDMYAMVVNGREVFYDPPLEEDAVNTTMLMKMEKEALGVVEEA